MALHSCTFSLVTYASLDPSTVKNSQINGDTINLVEDSDKVFDAGFAQSEASPKGSVEKARNEKKKKALEPLLRWIMTEIRLMNCCSRFSGGNGKH